MTNAGNRLAEISVASANNVSVTNSDSLSLGAAHVGMLLAQTLTGNLTLKGAITASGGGDSIVLVAASNFTNAGGSLNPGAGRWLVYSTDPAANSLGVLTSNFKRYNCKFSAGCAITTTGDGLLYTLAPVLSVSANPVSIVYGEQTTALTYSVTGLIDGDTSTTALAGRTDPNNRHIERQRPRSRGYVCH